MGKVFSAIWDRFWNNEKGTIIGLGSGLALNVVAAFVPYLSQQHPTWAPALGLLSGLVGSLLRDPGGSAATPAAPAAPSAPASVPPKTPAMLWMLVLILSAAPGLVRADSPKFGGCLTNPKYTLTCFGPSVSLSLVEMDIRTGTLTTGVAPGIGYGMTINTGKWYEAGASAYVSFRDTSTGTRLVPSLVFSFAEYVRLGIGQQIGGGGHPFLLLGVGANFGSSPTTGS